MKGPDLFRGEVAEASREAPPAPNLKVVLLALSMAQFINAYDTTAMNVAISAVVKSLHTTVSGVQSALVLYSLVMAAFMLTGGKLGDIWGRKKVFLAGISLYGAGALMTALSPSLPVMIVGWSLLEGMGSALMIPAVFATIGTVFPEGRARVGAFATVGAMSAAGAALGPLVCGLLATYLSWRASFLMEVAVVAAVIALTTRLKVAPPRRDGRRLDVGGALLSAAGLVLLISGVLLGGKFGWVTARGSLAVAGVRLVSTGGLSPVIPLVVAGLIVLAAFALWESRVAGSGGEPLLDIRSLRSRTAAFGLAAIPAMSLMLSGLLFVIPVFLQMAEGYSAFLTGLAILPMTVAVIAASAVVGRLSSKFEARRIIQAGFLALSGGIIGLALQMKGGAHPWVLPVGMMVCGLGVGALTAPLMSLAQGAVPLSGQSEIAGLSRALSNLGGAFGAAVAGAILLSTLTGSLSAQVAASPVIPQAEKPAMEAALHRDMQTVSDAQAKAFLATRGKPAELSGALVAMNASARDLGLRTALLGVGLLGLLGFAASCCLPKGQTGR